MGRTLAVLCSIAALAVGLTTGAAQSASAASGCWYSAGNWWCNNRVGAPVNGYRDDTREEKALLAKLSLRQVTADTLVGEPVTTVLTEAPGNGAALGRIKVATTNAWFAARSSGTEDVYKIYGESFLGPDHLRQVQEEARSVAPAALNA